MAVVSQDIVLTAQTMEVEGISVTSEAERGSVASALGRMHLFGTRVFAALVGGIDSATGWLGSIGPVELVAWTVGLSAFLVIAATATIVGLLRD